MVFKAVPDPVLNVKFVEFLKTGVFSVFLWVSLFLLSADINPTLVLSYMFMSCFCIIRLHVLCLTSGLLLLWFYSRLYWWLFVTESLEKIFQKLISTLLRHLCYSQLEKQILEHILSEYGDDYLLIYRGQCTLINVEGWNKHRYTLYWHEWKCD